MTETDVCNLALGSIGHDRTIASLTEGTAESVRCALFLPRARLAVLGAHDWGFLTREDPAVLGKLAQDGRRYMYARPFESLRICGMTDTQGEPVKFVYVNGMLLSECAEVVISYTLDNDDPEAWPEKVLDAVAWALAMRLAGPMTGKLEKIQMARQMAITSLLDAKAADCNETRDRGEPGNRYVDARS